MKRQDGRPIGVAPKGILSDSTIFLGCFLAGIAGSEAFTGSLWTAKGLLSALVSGGLAFALFSLYLWLVEGRLVTLPNAKAEASEVKGRLGPAGIYAVRTTLLAALGAALAAFGAYASSGQVLWQSAAVGAAIGAIFGAFSAFLRLRGW